MAKACVLNSSEASQLEHQGKVPACANHHHLAFGEAMMGVLSGYYRFCTAAGDTTNRRITKATEIIGYAGRPSIILKRDKYQRRAVFLGSMQVMQAIVKP